MIDVLGSRACHYLGRIRGRGMAAALSIGAVLLIAGCATGQGGGAAPVPVERLAQVEAECEALSAPGDGAEALRAALQSGGLASFYLVLRGAAEGAFWGAVTGGSAADSAWIGAAAGAGVGVIIGLVVGATKSVEEQRRVRAAFEGCVAERLASMETGVQDSSH